MLYFHQPNIHYYSIDFFIKLKHCCIFSVGNLRMACEAVASYLLFFPNDKTMQDNKNYYTNMPKVEKHFFKPRNVSYEYTPILYYGLTNF